MVRDVSRRGLGRRMGVVPWTPLGVGGRRVGWWTPRGVVDATGVQCDLPEKLVTGVFPKKWRRDLCREFVDVSES